MFYSALHTRQYFADAGNSLHIAVKQLRFIARFIVVCLLLSKKEASDAHVCWHCAGGRSRDHAALNSRPRFADRLAGGVEPAPGVHRCPQRLRDALPSRSGNGAAMKAEWRGRSDAGDPLA